VRPWSQVGLSCNIDGGSTPKFDSRRLCQKPYWTRRIGQRVGDTWAYRYGDNTCVKFSTLNKYWLFHLPRETGKLMKATNFSAENQLSTKSYRNFKSLNPVRLVWLVQTRGRILAIRQWWSRILSGTKNKMLKLKPPTSTQIVHHSSPFWRVCSPSSIQWGRSCCRTGPSYLSVWAVDLQPPCRLLSNPLETSARLAWIHDWIHDSYDCAPFQSLGNILWHPLTNLTAIAANFNPCCGLGG